MKKYVAIGHFDGNDNITCVAVADQTLVRVREDLKGNCFRAYVVLTEKKLEECKNADCLEIYDIVKKLTSNYRKRGIVADYIDQCMDIIEEKVAAI
jgi:hypothetical protein